MAKRHGIPPRLSEAELRRCRPTPRPGSSSPGPTARASAPVWVHLTCAVCGFSEAARPKKWWPEFDFVHCEHHTTPTCRPWRGRVRCEYEQIWHPPGGSGRRGCPGRLTGPAEVAGVRNARRPRGRSRPAVAPSPGRGEGTAESSSRADQFQAALRPGPARRRRRLEVVGHIAAEVGGVIGVHADQQVPRQHGRQRMCGDRHDARRTLEAGTPSAGSVGAQPRHQLRALQAADAVVDPLDPQQVERFPHVFRRTFLAGMGDRLSPAARARS